MTESSGSTLFGIDADLADITIGAAALFCLIANGPGLQRGAPVLMAAVALPLGAVGLVSLVLLALRGDTAARFGAAFLAWGLVAVLFSGQVLQSWDGRWSADRGWVYFAAYIGIWAIGRGRGASTRRLVTGALLTGLTLNVLLALVQTTSPNGVGLVSLAFGRASGFTQNPVYLGALMAGGVAMVAAITSASGPRWWRWLPLIALFATGGNLAGSRIGLVAMVVFAVAASWSGRDRWLRPVAVMAAIGLGIVAGAAALPQSGTGRLAASGGASTGLESRLTTWSAAAEAIGERPIVGWGPNRYQSATLPKNTLELANADGQNKIYHDAHNLLVEVGVATGLPGLALAVGFGWFAARRARGPLAWYAAGIAVTWLLEPFAVVTVPTAMLALGLAYVASTEPASAAPVASLEPGSATAASLAVDSVAVDSSVVTESASLGSATAASPASAAPVASGAASSDAAEVAGAGGARAKVPALAVVVAVVLGLVAGVSGARHVYVDRLVGATNTDPDQRGLLEQAHRLSPNDAGLADLYGRVLAEDAVLEGGEDLRVRALEASERAIELDPRSAAIWIDAAIARQRLLDLPHDERFQATRDAYVEAYALNPWSYSTLVGLYIADIELEDDEQVEVWREKLCALGGCPPMGE